MPHGVASTLWSKGLGWQIVCSCSWVSSCNEAMADTGIEFDQHLASARADELRDVELKVQAQGLMG